MKFRKKPVIIEAHQWFKNGDHPLDGATPRSGLPTGHFVGEGRVVRYYRHPDVSGVTPCKHCGRIMHVHGWIDTLEGGHIVCPGDWIITGVKGEHYPVKPDVFTATYEAATTDPLPEVTAGMEAIMRGDDDTCYDEALLRKCLEAMPLGKYHKLDTDPQTVYRDGMPVIVVHGPMAANQGLTSALVHLLNNREQTEIPQ